MDEIYLYHHLGLGDHISCHGIVRYYCEIYRLVYLFVKPHNHNNVKYMYNDLRNLRLIIGDDAFANHYLKNIENVKRIGFNLTTNINIEVQFYRMAGVPIEYKWDKFFISRNNNKELEVFNSLNLKPKEYVFVHDGGYKLKDLPSARIIKPESHGLFEWMYVIENAKEIHCIDSAFLCLVDCMQLNDIKLFNHKYPRKYPKYYKIYSNKDWNFIY